MTRRIHRTNIALAICIAAVFAKPSIAEDDDPLPNWLSFDSVRGTFSLRLAAEEGKEAEVVTIGPILFNNVPLTNFSRRWDGMTGAGFEHPLITIAHSMGDLLQRPSFRIQIESADNQPHHIEIPIKDNSDYFGGGERFQAINQKGYLLPMTSIDRPEPKGTSTYFPVPFYYSTRGYGVWVNSTLPGEFDLNGSDRFHVRLRYQADSLEIVLFAGPRHADVLRDFNRLVGPPRLPPPWAFAPWKSRDVHRNREEILEDVEKHRALDIPGSVLVIDSPWETCYNNFELNESQFVDADAMFARMGALGFHTCLWMTPFVNRTNVQDMSGIRVEACDEFATGAAAGHFVKGKNAEPLITSWWKGEGALIDFTSDEATAWWHTLLARTAKWKPRAFKCDDGEGNFVGDAIFADGARAEAMRNQYGVFYLHAARQYLAGAFGDDHAIIARTGFTGAQQHAICWAGDNEASFAFDNGLPSVILAGQTAALSGIPGWGSEISGYFGTPDKELFIRWT
ncbi:MAG: TIM-barrel domain-containing protein, partial [Phycisphaerae bacterium]